MVFLLCGIAVEYLYLDAWQIVRHNVAWHIDSLWLEVIDFLNRVGPFHLAGVWKLSIFGLWIYHNISCGKCCFVTCSCIGLSMSMAYLFSQKRTILMIL